MIFTDHSSNPKKIALSRRLLSVSFGLVILLFSVLSFSSYSFYQENVRLNKLTTAQNKSDMMTAEEIERQKEEIRTIAGNMKVFQDDLLELKGLDKKIRLITALGEQKTEDFFGVGGPEDRDFVNMDELIDNNDTATALSYLANDLRELKEVAAKQKISFQEISKYLREQSSILSATPSIWPVKGWVSSGFGYRISPFTGLRKRHEGIDIVSRTGTPVISPASGVVTKAFKDGGYGNLVEIKHGYGLVTRFGHNSKIFVKVGDHVKRGQVISKVGSTGHSTGPHLHYEVLLNGVPVNPMNYIFN